MNTEKNAPEEVPVNDGATALTIINQVFGILFFGIGVVNTFWGGDTGFGIFITLLSLVYLLPVQALVRKKTGYVIPKVWLLKVLLGLFIGWAAMGVGELFDKLEMMVQSF